MKTRGDRDISEKPFMPEDGDTKTCTARSCTGTMEFRVRRSPPGTAPQSPHTPPGDALRNLGVQQMWA